MGPPGAAEGALRHYPNPSTDTMLVDGLNDENAQVDIYSPDGRWLALNREQEVSVSAFSKGVYILMLKFDDGGVFYKKWIRE